MGLAVRAGSVGTSVGSSVEGASIGTKIVGVGIGSGVGGSEPQASSARANRTTVTVGIRVRFISVSGSRFHAILHIIHANS